MIIQNQSKELNLGRAGEYLVLADLLLKGFQAYDTGQGVSYDVVVDYKNILIRLQVKTTQKIRKIKQRSNPIYFFHLKRSGKNGNKFYQQGMFDGFALVALDRKEIFYLLFDEKIKTSSICIRDKNIDYSGNRGGGRSGLYLQDLNWQNFIKRWENYTGDKAIKI